MNESMSFTKSRVMRQTSLNRNPNTNRQIKHTQNSDFEQIMESEMEIEPQYNVRPITIKSDFITDTGSILFKNSKNKNINEENNKLIRNSLIKKNENQSNFKNGIDAADNHNYDDISDKDASENGNRQDRENNLVIGLDSKEKEKVEREEEEGDKYLNDIRDEQGELLNDMMFDGDDDDYEDNEDDDNNSSRSSKSSKSNDEQNYKLENINSDQNNLLKGMFGKTINSDSSDSSEDEESQKNPKNKDIEISFHNLTSKDASQNKKSSKSSSMKNIEKLEEFQKGLLDDMFIDDSEIMKDSSSDYSSDSDKSQKNKKNTEKRYKDNKDDRDNLSEENNYNSHLDDPHDDDNHLYNDPDDNNSDRSINSKKHRDRDIDSPQLINYAIKKTKTKNNRNKLLKSLQGSEISSKRNKKKQRSYKSRISNNNSEIQLKSVKNSNYHNQQLTYNKLSKNKHIRSLSGNNKDSEDLGYINNNADSEEVHVSKMHAHSEIQYNESPVRNEYQSNYEESGFRIISNKKKLAKIENSVDYDDNKDHEDDGDQNDELRFGYKFPKNDEADISAPIIRRYEDSDKSQDKEKKLFKYNKKNRLMNKKKRSLSKLNFGSNEYIDNIENIDNCRKFENERSFGCEVKMYGDIKDNDSQNRSRDKINQEEEESRDINQEENYSQDINQEENYSQDINQEENYSQDINQEEEEKDDDDDDSQDINNNFKNIQKNNFDKKEELYKNYKESIKSIKSISEDKSEQENKIKLNETNSEDRRLFPSNPSSLYNNTEKERIDSAYANKIRKQKTFDSAYSEEESQARMTEEMQSSKNILQNSKLVDLRRDTETPFSEQKQNILNREFSEFKNYKFIDITPTPTPKLPNLNLEKKFSFNNDLAIHRQNSVDPSSDFNNNGNNHNNPFFNNDVNSQNYSPINFKKRGSSNFGSGEDKDFLLTFKNNRVS